MARATADISCWHDSLRFSNNRCARLVKATTLKAPEYNPNSRQQVTDRIDFVSHFIDLYQLEISIPDTCDVLPHECPNQCRYTGQAIKLFGLEEAMSIDRRSFIVRSAGIVAASAAAAVPLVGFLVLLANNMKCPQSFVDNDHGDCCQQQQEQQRQ